MRSRGSNNRLSSSRSAFRWRISSLVLSMFATMAAFFVACRLWQEAESRVYLVKELDRRTGQGESIISVDDTLKVIDCREQQKKLSLLQMELEEAKKEGYVSKHLIETKGTNEKKKLLAVVGILTGFGRKHNRYAIRKAWMPTGTALTKLEDEKGIIIRFVIGRSLNHGDNSDRDINNENIKEKDFLILNDHVETAEEKPKKTKLFFIDALEHWDAEFYVKVNDDIYLNIDALGAILSNHVDKPRAYIGCMKSGGVFSKPTDKWYEPEWWKFGDRKSYFRHASGEIFAVSQALAQFISINKLILRSYAHDDVSVGSWLIGLDVKHVDEGKFCCSSWSSGALCAAS
ncbi:hydroxyproline O-galactosyltransferase HPGT1-like [Cynara cardunculus var. scolymus]|uniref:hydroxyproline O-galactosyltransferase HPGT1-like n=1 Tax=Cynara cardunculus var. scolymus TaxID=59895 RepID=UPI000D62A7BF|nr:hydroxyproline O-galactosyltransferase HPGT1-like [Cynara cardunculus var. scolymus]